MSVRVKLDGFAELREQLRNLPTHLAEEAGGIVTRHAHAAEAHIQAAYPTGPSGNLKRGVKVDQVQVSGAAAHVRLRSTARHAHLFEFGTQARHTSLGYNRGPMPAAHVFIPTVVRERRQMTEDLIAMLKREGLTVQGG